MKKYLKFMLLAIVGVFMLSGCGVAVSPTLNQNLQQTNVVLSKNNFKIVKEVSGQSSATYVFGIGGLSRAALTENAAAEMRANAGLKGSQAIINQSVMESVTSIGNIYIKRVVTVTGTVIEFTE